MAPLVAKAAALRHSSLRAVAQTSRTTIALRQARFASFHQPPPQRPAGRGVGILSLAAVALLGLAGGAAVTAYPILAKKEPVEVPRAEIEFEKERPASSSKEENRDLVSSQHLQVKKSWENPGIYAWGSNSGKVVAPDSDDKVVKTPRRIPYFDGQLVRDLKLDREFGVAVTEKGDLVQWGAAFSTENPTPSVTLSGKDIVKLAISKDRVLALSASGSVYSLPVSQKDQQSGKKETPSSWLPLWSAPASINYRILKPNGLGWNEKVIDISSGLEHALLLTSSGRVFASASSSQDFPSKGQLGIPGLTWATRPKGSYDQPHEVGDLKGYKIKQVASGDYHSVVLDDEGRVFAFGDNSSGQLGLPFDTGRSILDTPSLIPFQDLYKGTKSKPRVTSVAAGGYNSFFTIDTTKLAEEGASEAVIPGRNEGRVAAETWASGEGIYGSLGTGRWTHISDGPSKVKSLSNLFEWDEKAGKVVPIRVASLSVGSTHSAAVMKNISNVGASSTSSENDTNFGEDVLWWGGNEFYQLGTGKRNNLSTPTNIGPLDGGEGDAQKGRKGEVHRFQIAPRATVRLGPDGQGRKVSVEQRVECGRFVTAVYSAA